METNLQQSLSGVSAFLEDLAADTPAPGGGASAAIIGAIACAQSAMVAGLSLQNRICQQAPERLDALSRLRASFSAYQERFLQCMSDDAVAYAQLSEVFKMERSTPQEEQERHALLQEHLIQATNPPFAVLRCAQEALVSVAELADVASTMTRTDLIVAALALKASARGGEAMVRANTMYLADSQEAKKLEAEAHRLAHDADERSQDIYQAINNPSVAQ